MKRSFRLAVAALIGCVVVSCGEGPTAPTPVAPNAAPVLRDSSANLLFGLLPSSLIYCPSSQNQSTTSVIDALGGVLSVGGTSVTIPVGALLGPVTMTLTVPASNFMEVDVSVEGTEHFIFEQPVIVNLNYSRCGSFRARFLPVESWYIDSDTHKLLQNMIGVDNKLTKTITFTTIHLSGYAIAN